jgi:hypothetical protein
MKYVLILRTGKVMTFFIKSVAETYQVAYGGTLVTDEPYASVYAEFLAEA